jgi:heme/copper-type cytochrome/quinol oxidase subunit 2
VTHAALSLTPKLSLLARVGPLLAAVVSLTPGSAWACAACYGQSDSPMAKGMNWGIFSLLGFIVVVLGGVAAFFIYLARRAAAAPIPASPARSEEAPSGTWIEATSKL